MFLVFNLFFFFRYKYFHIQNNLLTLTENRRLVLINGSAYL